METNLLLQEIERFEGICILTTNHEKNMDEAFRRRIQFKINFPFPDDKHRAKIWRTLIPREAPVGEDIDFTLLGKNFEISGGYIKNAIVRAAYRAAVAHEPISMRHIEDSAEQECKNAGKIFRSIHPRDDHFPL
jgi:AAA+ superfamily predicted ATPase